MNWTKRFLKGGVLLKPVLLHQSLSFRLLVLFAVISCDMNSLHDRYVTVKAADGREKRLSALDASRLENVQFVEFRPPPVDDSEPGAVDAWVERANYIIDDLTWLLKLPYDRYITIYFCNITGLSIPIYA